MTVDSPPARRVLITAGRVNTLVIDRPPVAAQAVRAGVFALDSSFPTPAVASLLRAVRETASQEPDKVFCVFGHTDRSGGDDSNKKLSELRADATLALLTADLDLFDQVADEADWGLAVYQTMLRGLGCNCGAIDGETGSQTERAVRGFQEEYGRGIYHRDSRRAPRGGALQADGLIGPNTKRALRDAYLDEFTVEIERDRFVGARAAGCSEFNPIDDVAQVNRRVTVAVIERAKLPASFPCARGEAKACPLDARGVQRCTFYRDLVAREIGPSGEFHFFDYEWLRTHTGKLHLSALTLLPDSDDVEIVVQRCTQRRPQELDCTVGGPLPEFGAEIGRVPGLIRNGVAYGLWEPGDDFDPLDMQQWFDGAHEESAEAADLRPYQPPVFAVRSGNSWGTSGAPGMHAGGIDLEPVSDRPYYGIGSDGDLYVIDEFDGGWSGVGARLAAIFHPDTLLVPGDEASAEEV